MVTVPLVSLAVEAVSETVFSPLALSPLTVNALAALVAASTNNTPWLTVVGPR